ncbi:hypothetical protein BJI49_07520 [Acetobacter pasteurianus]|uniref:Uncharacterized protein n=1 Tax=Acetobacter pasteurianus TaxID=438 RepID=A0A1A0DFZ6_ACEPA|nr:YfdX family protein [Acetobacter pasteurianus]OAZ73900.1 hypothetical protein SRCM100623_00729 [Acetobacter pasteurianus]RCL07136.1 hypothetical protein BJI49_07520 [Acetobacter pasteurianus]GAB31149.1 hypothetical protein APS_1751 [Acetobacter pasteurianus subsp. pasteurianus LMG 1262 = NBRC 106471]GCD48790.1 hypothetical protein NBRC106471_0346 [Acetobacter pasteurianus subsp. pasteurianus LMG 1262 = NBRC 106471]
MRLKALFAASAVLLTSFSVAQAGTVHTTWEKFKAGHAMHRLSVDGQKAMMDVFQARDLLAQGKTDAAIPPLYDAQKRFKAASADNKKFFATESQLQPAPQHPVSANHTPVANPTTWVPVGGEFIVSETLAPEKQAALANANKQFQAGQTQQAQQSLQVVGEDADFILALAPLEQSEGALYRAKVFTEGRQPQQAVEALNQLLDGIVFVSDDVVEKVAPSTPSKKSN